MIVAALVLVMSLAFVGCDSEATTEIRDGDCMNTDDLPVELVDCSGEWKFRVINSFDVADADRYPGDNFFWERAAESCDRRYSSFRFPGAETWGVGDRTVYCIQASFGLSVIDPDKLDRLVSRASLGSGECYNEAPETDVMSVVELVECSGEWEFRVINSFDVADADRYPGDNFFGERAAESCDRRYSSGLFPGAGTWGFGDRTVNCLQDSFGLSVIDPGKLDRLVSRGSLGSGECFNVALETDDQLVELVDCSGEWEFRVLNSFDVADADRYPGENFFWERADESCDRRYRSVVSPNTETWGVGDRTVKCIQHSFGLSVIDPGKLDRLVKRASLGSGECFNVALETDDLSVELVECSGEWKFRVLNSFDVADADRYPGENFFLQRAAESCDQRFSSFLLPDTETWGVGDRTVYCLQDSFGLSVIDPGKLDRLVNRVSLGSGECFNGALETDDQLVELVECSGEWEFRVLNSFDVADADRYPGENFFRERAVESCDRRYSYGLSPGAETWEIGDRTVKCLQHSFGLSVIDPGKLDRLVKRGSLGSGECFNGALETDDQLVELVECSGEWDSRVLNSFDVADADRYPGENFFLQRAAESCDRRYSYGLFPGAETWEVGDRTVKCLQDSFGLSVIDPGKLDRLVKRASLGSGECYNEAPEIDLPVELVDCSGEWEFRVLNSFDVADADRYPGENFFRQRADESCDRRFSYFLFPNTETWGFGDRTVRCLQEN